MELEDEAGTAKRDGGADVNPGGVAKGVVPRLSIETQANRKDR